MMPSRYRRRLKRFHPSRVKGISDSKDQGRIMDRRRSRYTCLHQIGAFSNQAIASQKPHILITVHLISRNECKVPCSGHPRLRIVTWRRTVSCWTWWSCLTKRTHVQRNESSCPKKYNKRQKRISRKIKKVQIKGKTKLKWRARMENSGNPEQTWVQEKWKTKQKNLK